MHSIAANWGISDISLFASATLQKTWVPGRAVHVNTKQSLSTLFERHKNAKDRLKGFLKDTQLVPRELVFIGRNMNNVRANNRSMGSPVNRINIMAYHAVESLGNDWRLWYKQDSLPNTSKSRLGSLSVYVQSRLNYLRFRSTLFATSVGFYLTRFWQWVEYCFTGKDFGGFEALADSVARKALQDQFGLEIDPSAFEG